MHKQVEEEQRHQFVRIYPVLFCQCGEPNMDRQQNYKNQERIVNEHILLRLELYFV